MLYTWRLWTIFKVNTFFFSLCIETHISRQDRWDERSNFFHWQRKRFSYSGINHTFQPSKSQSLKQFWKINHVLLGFVFLSVVNLKKKYVKKTVNSRNNFSHKYRKQHHPSFLQWSFQNNKIHYREDPWYRQADCPLESSPRK